MVILRILTEAVSIIIAALAGNWVGGEVRFILTGKPAQSIRFHYTTAEGREISNIPVVTKFYPALLIGLARKPRWLYAFLGGIATGALVNERYERLAWRLFEKALLQKSQPVSQM